MNRAIQPGQLLRCELAARRQKLLWILRDPSHQDLKMQMRSGRAPGASNLGNFLPALDQITAFDQYSRSMGITRDQVIAVIDFNHVAIGWMKLLRHHHTTGRCHDGGSSSPRVVP